MATDKEDSIREQKALREKERGNQAFKNGKFDEAINKYSLAIECDQGQPVIYCNRAMAYLKLNRFYEAKLDCDEAIKLDCTYVKAYFRRGLANSSLKDVDSAMTDFNCVLELDPNNKEAKNELIKLEKMDACSNKKACRIEFLDEKAQKLVQSAPLKKIDICQIGNEDFKDLQNGAPNSSRNELLSDGNKAPKRSSSKNSVVSAAVIAKLASILPTDEQKSISSLMSSMILDTPKSAFQFLNGWRTLKSDPKKFCNYLLKIPVSNYINVIDSCLEPDLISDMLIAYSEHGLNLGVSDCQDQGQEEKRTFLDRCQPIFDSLCTVTKLKNFKTSKLFFEEKDFSKVNAIVDRLKRENVIDDNELEILRNCFTG